MSQTQSQNNAFAGITDAATAMSEATANETDLVGRAWAALTLVGLTIESLGSALPTDIDGLWYPKIADALEGRRSFTSTMLALFADAVDVSVLWLITSERPATMSIHSCVINEAVTSGGR